MKKVSYITPEAEVWTIVPGSVLCVSTEDASLTGLSNEGVTSSGESFLW